MIAHGESKEFPIPAGRNVAILVAQILAIGGFIAGAKYAGAWWHVVLLAAGFGILMNSVYATIHEAEHGVLLPNRKINDFAGTVMALFFPGPFHLLRQGHIGHHLRNRSDDEAFDFWFEGEHPVWKAMQFYGVLTGIFWIVLVLANVVVLVCPWVMRPRNFGFDRPSMALMASLNPAYSRWIWWEALAVISLHTAIVWGFGIPVLHYVGMYFGFGFMWSAMQYVHHFGTERHVTRGAKNLFLFAPIDVLWLHHNWHQTHHEHPTVPWTYLPAIGQKENPARGFLPWHYIRMWRGPRKGSEHVENKYAGQVIR